MIYIPTTTEPNDRPSGSACNATMQQASEPLKQRIPTHSNQRGIILVIDDSVDIRNLIRRALERVGWSVLEAEDGLSGLDQVRAAAASLSGVILDITMPEMDGLEVLQHIRQLDPELPVALMTGHELQAVAHSSAKAFPTCVLFKPFSLKELHEVLELLHTARRS